MIQQFKRPAKVQKESSLGMIPAGKEIASKKWISEFPVGEDVMNSRPSGFSHRAMDASSRS